ncbi:unnamed protein product [Triticum turgidum subsp. durum]|uniref:Uncharacterized protein n=1 Tax=Triticum turgidum subsp. durum TaxID=4567 RepID=A0A9R1NYH3_TRITD|nr:unnamed protein product [Triticum turgidum subsp. durum]
MAERAVTRTGGPRACSLSRGQARTSQNQMVVAESSSQRGDLASLQVWWPTAAARREAAAEASNRQGGSKQQGRFRQRGESAAARRRFSEARSGLEPEIGRFRVVLRGPEARHGGSALITMMEVFRGRVNSARTMRLRCKGVVRRFEALDHNRDGSARASSVVEDAGEGEDADGPTGQFDLDGAC